MNRKRFWNRLRTLGLIGEPELIRVHRIAQQQGIAPEDAAVALGMLTESQVRELRVPTILSVGGTALSFPPSGT